MPLVGVVLQRQELDHAHEDLGVVVREHAAQYLVHVVLMNKEPGLDSDKETKKGPVLL